MKETLYVGAALSGAPDWFKTDVWQLIWALREAGYTVLEFVTDANATNDFVYLHDVEQLKKCDLMIAVTAFPSTGLGLELGIALFRFLKPILALFPEPSNGLAPVSRMIKGINAEVPDSFYRMCTYREMNDVIENEIERFVSIDRKVRERDRQHVIALLSDSRA